MGMSSDEMPAMHVVVLVSAMRCASFSNAPSLPYTTDRLGFKGYLQLSYVKLLCLPCFVIYQHNAMFGIRLRGSSGSSRVVSWELEALHYDFVPLERTFGMFGRAHADMGLCRVLAVVPMKEILHPFLFASQLLE